MTDCQKCGKREAQVSTYLCPLCAIGPDVIEDPEPEDLQSGEHYWIDVEGGKTTTAKFTYNHDLPHFWLAGCEMGFKVKEVKKAQKILKPDWQESNDE